MRRDWRMEAFIEKEVERIRTIVGPTAQVIGAVSGGVDSSVAAKLMHEAIGDRFHAIMVDNGVLRMDEAADVHRMLNQDLGVNLTVCDASDRFLEKLKGVLDPEQKRKIIGNTFIHVFEEEAARIEKAQEGQDRGPIEYLLQGTLYPDVIESLSFKGPSATIKTHHNVRLAGRQACAERSGRRSAREHEAQAHRALARAVQGRSPRARSSARHPSAPRRAASLPRSWPLASHPRRGHEGTGARA